MDLLDTIKKWKKLIIVTKVILNKADESLVNCKFCGEEAIVNEIIILLLLVDIAIAT